MNLSQHNIKEDCLPLNNYAEACDSSLPAKLIPIEQTLCYHLLFENKFCFAAVPFCSSEDMYLYMS